METKGLPIFLPSSGSWIGHRTNQSDIHTRNSKGTDTKEAVEELTASSGVVVTSFKVTCISSWAVVSAYLSSAFRMVF